MIDRVLLAVGSTQVAGEEIPQVDDMLACKPGTIIGVMKFDTQAIFAPAVLEDIRPAVVKTDRKSGEIAVVEAACVAGTLYGYRESGTKMVLEPTNMLLMATGSKSGKFGLNAILSREKFANCLCLPYKMNPNEIEYAKKRIARMKADAGIEMVTQTVVVELTPKEIALKLLSALEAASGALTLPDLLVNAGLPDVKDAAQAILDKLRGAEKVKRMNRTQGSDTVKVWALA